MNKTPYEIRLELMHLAKGMLDNQLESQVEFAKKAFELATATNREVIATWQDFSPKTYSVEDVIGLATKMNEFISRPNKND